MEYSKLLDLATDLGYKLAMSGAETFRVEESITRILKAYDIEAEVFVIPNCMHVSIEPIPGRPQTRMRRIGLHGNDLDSVEKYSDLSRKICRETPAPEIADQWLKETTATIRRYSFLLYILASALSALGYAIMMGGSVLDGLVAGVSGIIVGLVIKWMDRLGANQFFQTVAAAFPMALLAYVVNAFFPTICSDAVNIGALMILVPGWLFTNAMRDIIYGDTNSGLNRIVQVILIAVAIALGAAAAWNVTALVWKAPVSAPVLPHHLLVECVACAIGCWGFAILFNLHGPGVLICMLGGALTWATYAVSMDSGCSAVTASFFGGIVASLYAEIFARIRKYPAISYLLVSLFPLIPGYGVYYTMVYAVQGDITNFASKGMDTAAVAGVLALGVILVSTAARMIHFRKKA